MAEDIFAKLNDILDDPNAFEQFKKSMGITDDMLEQPTDPQENKIDPSSFLGNDFSNIDFGQIMGMLPLLQSFGGGGVENHSAQLLRSLKPFLSHEKQPKVDTAISILKLLDMLPMLSQLNLFSGGQQQ